MAECYPFSCTFAYQVHVHNISHHIYNNSHRACLNNVANKRLAFQYTRQYLHMLFHQPATCIPGYSHNSNLSKYLHIYGHIDEFPLWHIHPRYNVVVRLIHRYNQRLYCKQGDNQYIDHSYKWIDFQDMYYSLFCNQLRLNCLRNRLPLLRKVTLTYFTWRLEDLRSCLTITSILHSNTFEVLTCELLWWTSLVLIVAELSFVATISTIIIMIA